MANGEIIASPGKGPNIDVWETDGNGLYDNQYNERDRPDTRVVVLLQTKMENFISNVSNQSRMPFPLMVLSENF